MINKSISELYDSGYISGDAFLYYAERNLGTIQDIMDAGVLEEEPAPYGKEIRSCLEIFGINSFKEESTKESENLHVSEEIACSSDEDVESIYNRAIFDLDIRTVHALQKMRRMYDDFDTYFAALTSNDNGFWLLFEKLPAVGKKSLERARNFALSLTSEVVANDIMGESHKMNELTENQKRELDGLEDFFEAQLRTLSTRSYNAMCELYEICGKSFSSFYIEISNPGFNIKDIHNVGKKSAEELNLWINSIKDFVATFFANGLSAKQSELIAINKLQLLGIKGDLEEILRLYEHMGYFPYFAAIQSYFSSLADRDQRVIKYQLDIFASKELYGLKEASKLLGLTSERTRQLRNGVFEQIQLYIESLTKITANYPLCDSYFKTDVKDINLSEGTNFNDDFVKWVISILAPERYVLLGNIEDAFYNPYGKELPLVLVSRKFNGVFSFDKFIKYLSAINEEKRVDDRSIILKDCVLGFFKDRIYYEYIDEIIRECKTIVSTLFDFEISNETIHIRKNAERNNPELVEIIIREAGHSMTLDEIYTEFQKRYPNRTKSANSLAGALRLNSNISCVGRSSTYTLTEWTHGEHRGGTIREFATEYLLSLSPSIAPLEDIGNYVRRFRPASSDKSIHANLLLGGTYDIFYKEEVRYIGFANQEYPEEYRRFCSQTDSRRDFKSSCTLLEQFVVANERLPFSSNVPEDEKRLCRFWNIQLQKLAKGTLGEEEKCIVEQMQDRFEKFKIDKREFDWLQSYNKIKEHFDLGGQYSELSPTLQKWINIQMTNLKYNKAPFSKTDLLIELANIINDAQ